MLPHEFIGSVVDKLMNWFRIEGGRMGLFAANGIPKTGMYANCSHRCFQLLVSKYFCSMLPAGLIDFCWGRFRVTRGGPAEDLFNPIYEGFFDRILKLHRFSPPPPLLLCEAQPVSHSQ